jgi:HKD family nuclease
MPVFIENHQTLLVSQIKNLLRQAEEAYFALAFVRHSGVNLLKSDIEALIKRNGNVHLLFANDFGATEVSAIETLQEIGVSLKFYSNVVSFHPKAYIFKIKNAIWAIIGSSNLSVSGLTKGTEWNVLVSPQDMDCSPILAEFNRLWISPSAEYVNEYVLSNLRQQDRNEVFLETLREQDQYPNKPIKDDVVKIFNDGKSYIIRRRPDHLRSWNFQIYSSKINQFGKQGEFNVVVICDFDTAKQKIFVIPYNYLRDYIFPFAHYDERGRYLFEVSKHTYRFNWHHSIGMDGNQFLLE